MNLPEKGHGPEVQNQKPVWDLHISAATPPLLFSVASTTHIVGHNIFTSIVDRKVYSLHRLCVDCSGTQYGTSINDASRLHKNPIDTHPDQTTPNRFLSCR